MILQTSSAELMHTVLTLLEAGAPGAGRRCRSLAQVRSAYRLFLRGLAQRDIDPGTDGIAFITDPQRIARLRGYFINDSLLDDRQQARVIAPAQDGQLLRKRQRLEQALAELSLYARDYRDFVGTLVTDIFILPSDAARAGSSSQAIGLVWMNPRLTYTITDIIEMLVHEFTHHAMFLDELRHRHYRYELVVDRATWTRSAILHTPRPLDKVLHSIAVATEVLLLRCHVLGHPAAPRVHPPTPRMTQQLDAALTGAEATLASHPGILSGRGEALLRNARHLFTSELRALTTPGASVFAAPPLASSRHR